MRTFFQPASPISIRLSILAVIIIAFASGVTIQTAQAQSLSSYDRQRGQEILRIVKNNLQKNYYDTTFRNINIEARFKEAEELIKKAQSNGQIFGIIASVLIELNDSHTTFFPPPRVARTDYGWQMQMVGDKCHVLRVTPGSDAAAKGLKAGDMVLSVDGIVPNRQDLWKIQYLYYNLRPQPGMRIVVASPDGKQRELDVMAKVTEGRRVTDLTNDVEWERYLLELEKEDQLNPHRFYSAKDGEWFIWKMPGFDLYKDKEVDDIMAKIKKHKSLILDLRGNGGGLVVMLERLVGHLFDRDVKIADLKGRKEMKPMLAKTRGKEIFTGKIIVLIDSRSGSAAEIFARLMQLEKRGTVLGDVSAGAVMQSRIYPGSVGIDTITSFGMNITNADVIMADGKSLEHTGVTPDEVILPTAEDMATGRDPVLARAAGIIGYKLDPVQAGKLFPVEWSK